MLSIMEFLSGFLSSGEWPRLLLAILLYAMTWQISKKYEIPFIVGLRLIPFIYIGRELIAAFLYEPALFYASDALVLIVILWWLNNYVRKPRTAIISTVAVAIVSTALLILYQVFELTILLVSLNLAMSVMIGIIGFRMFDISVYNTERADYIIQNRMGIVILLGLTRVSFLFAPLLASPFARYILLPLTMVPSIYFIFRYDMFFYSNQVENEDFNAEYLNSLFDFMQTIGTAMTERIEVKAVLEYVMQAIVQYTDAEAGVVLLRNTDDNTLRLNTKIGYFPPPYELPQIVATKISSVETYFETHPVPMGETVIGEAALQNEPVFIRNTVEDGRMTPNIKDNTMFISSLIAIPIVVNNEVFGIVSVIQRSNRELFSELDYERTKVFVEYASLTLDSLYNYAQLLEKQEIEREVNIAGEIQKKLLPGRMPKRVRQMVSAWSQPAKGVSGDYYDIITLNRDGKLGMVICDVAGKGVPASLIMVMIRTIIHLVAGSTQDASRVVRWINRGIAGRIDIERFATLSYLTFDPNTNQLEYSNAAHHPLVIMRAENGNLEKLDSEGLPIGLERDADYERKTTNLEPGDAIMLYTDGIIEALNTRGEQYEEERLQTVFVNNSSLSSEEILKAIRTDIEDFVGNAKQHDDQTLIVMKA